MSGMMTLSVSVRLLSSPSDALTISAGGNIKGAVNSPSESFTQNVTELVRRYEEGKFDGAIGNRCLLIVDVTVPKVVFRAYMLRAQSMSGWS